MSSLETEILNTKVFDQRGWYKDNRYDLLEYAATFAPEYGLVCEFGVRTGQSMSVITNKLGNAVGFDSFEGLPEDWVVSDESTQWRGLGKMLAVPSIPNAKLIKGWFEDTVPEYFAKNTENIRFAHIDCDLYSSTVTVLDAIKPFLVSGSVIVFDELMQFEKSKYANWREHEFKALLESNISVKPIGRTNAEQVALIVV